MGQQPSKEQARLQELRGLIFQTHELLRSLRRPAATEFAAGIPAAPGSDQALYDAVLDHYKRLQDEKDAILGRMSEYRPVQPAYRVQNSGCFVCIAAWSASPKGLLQQH